MSNARNLADLARTTTTATELNKLDGFTGDVADLNYAKELKATGVTPAEFDNLDLSNLESHRYTTLLDSWVAHNPVASTTSESGIWIQRMGPLYIASVNIYKNVGGNVNPAGAYHVLTLDSNITNPTNIVYMGTQHFGNSANSDFVGLLRIESDGKLKINFRNQDANEMIISGNFIGLDTP